MTTWVPTCAPNLWGHSSWECPSCSRAMHAAYPWNVTLTGLSSPSGSLLVLRLNVSYTPHAWILRDLGFSLTGNWCVVWDPPLVAQLHCLTWPCPRTRQHILMTDAWTLLNPLGVPFPRHSGHTACGTQLTRPTPDHSSTSWACRLQGPGPCRTWDPIDVAPRQLVGTQPPSLKLLTCSAKRLSPRLWRPTWLCVTGREQCTKVILLCARFNLCTRVLINDQDLTPLALLCLR